MAAARDAKKGAGIFGELGLQEGQQSNGTKVSSPDAYGGLSLVQAHAWACRVCWERMQHTECAVSTRNIYGVERDTVL